MVKVSKDHCLEIINKFEPCSENQKQGVLGIDGECISSLSHAALVVLKQNSFLLSSGRSHTESQCVPSRSEFVFAFVAQGAKWLINCAQLFVRHHSQV